MNRFRIHIRIAALVAAMTVALAAGPVAGSQAAVVESYPTGNAELDQICDRMAGLINHAYEEGHYALVYGDDEGAEAWFDLARDMIRRATGAGCKLTQFRLPPKDSVGPGGDDLQVAPGSDAPASPPSGGATTPEPGSGTPAPPRAQPADASRPVPSNAFGLAKPKVNAAKGTVTLRVAVPGPGRVQARATGRMRIARKAVTAKKAGMVSLRLKPTGKAKRILRKKRKLAATLKVSFTPAGGRSRSARRTSPSG